MECGRAGRIEESERGVEEGYESRLRYDGAIKI